MGGYFVGVNFGKHKLLERISPKSWCNWWNYTMSSGSTYSKPFFLDNESNSMAYFRSVNMR